MLVFFTMHGVSMHNKKMIGAVVDLFHVPLLDHCHELAKVLFETFELEPLGITLPDEVLETNQLFIEGCCSQSTSITTSAKRGLEKRI